jgi:hypothetical protein
MGGLIAGMHKTILNISYGVDTTNNSGGIMYAQTPVKSIKWA